MIGLFPLSTLNFSLKFINFITITLTQIDLSETSMQDLGALSNIINYPATSYDISQLLSELVFKTKLIDHDKFVNNSFPALEHIS